MASLDAKTGMPDPKFGKNGVVDLMDGLGFPLVPLAVDDSGPLVISDAAPARKAQAGRERGTQTTKTGADGTVGIDPALGQIAASCPPIIVNDVIIVGNSHIHGYYPIRVRNLPELHPRLRRPHRQAALEVQPGAASRASSAPRRGRTARRSGHAGRRQERRVGAVLGRSRAGPRLHPGRHAADGRVRRPSSGRQPVRQQHRRARREDRASASGTSRWCITTSGTTTRRWRRTCSTSPSTASRGRSSRRPPSRAGSTCSIA